ncbi:zinc ribbon domain-containing protein [uncultured Methanobrevibacter sp.]|uniref:zinc ribbon domain-containing protein n=1 Tax=uncultured Methanobrevibacter sp. TaxID=253161 RepID=UPI0025F08CB0|nr:zinc ribbon domain-containing protein [uncultured Methanobrevibacter sp.]
MANFCTNCGAKIGKDDNFCTSCGTKLKNEDNFCTNCGAKIRKEDKFCMNCGAKIDRTDIKQKKPLLKSIHEAMEKNRERIAKEKEEEEKKILKRIDEIFESEEIQSEIRKNNIRQKHVLFIKDDLKYKLIHKKEEMSDEEIKYFIKTELANVNKKQETVIIPKEKDIIRKKTEKTKTVRGGHCNLNCRHCYEEFLDSGGGIVGDFDSEGYTEYYCHLGHSISFGSFCEDYE